jgi:hypothetical protein
MSAVDILASVSIRESVLLMVVERPAVLMEYNNSSCSSVTKQSRNEGEESFRVNRGALGMSEWLNLVTAEDRRELVRAIGLDSD